VAIAALVGEDEAYLWPDAPHWREWGREHRDGQHHWYRRAGIAVTSLEGVSGLAFEAQVVSAGDRSGIALTSNSRATITFPAA
jgi:hypothetical protein